MVLGPQEGGGKLSGRAIPTIGYRPNFLRITRDGEVDPVDIAYRPRKPIRDRCRLR